MEQITVGCRVIRLGSEQNYTTGRKGEVLEVSEVTGRCRVAWDTEWDGKPITTRKKITNELGVSHWAHMPGKIKTHVHMRFLKVEPTDKDSSQ